MKSSDSRKARRVAFTLIELMISLGLMVVMMLGVNYIFSGVGNATGQTQTLSRITRDAQAAQAVFAMDFGSAVTSQSDVPFFMIESAVKAAFLTQNDRLGDLDADPVSPTSTQIRTRDLNSNNVETDPGELTSNAIYNARNHRLDKVSFFGRKSFRRQTGNDGTYVSDIGSAEAFISYGHLRLYDDVGAANQGSGGGPNGDGSYPHPGENPATGDPNPNNLYATQWILGRTAILLIPPDASGDIRDNVNVQQVYYDKGGALSPLVATANDSAGVWPTSSSRYDLAGTSIAAERAAIISHCNTTNADWWTRFSYPLWGNPHYMRPVNSQKLALTVPMFVNGCTQFIVEFAGDYLNQDPLTGNIVDVHSYLNATTFIDRGSVGTDGEVDYIVATEPGGTKSRQVRWYGLPRDVDGDGQIPVNISDPNAIKDVVPLRDLIKIKYSDVVKAPMERTVLPYPSANNYAATTGGMTTTGKYFAVWGPPGSYGKTGSPPSWSGVVPAPPLPRMIRIVMVVDDPSGRLAEGKSFEFVFKLQ